VAVVVVVVVAVVVVVVVWVERSVRVEGAAGGVGAANADGGDVRHKILKIGFSYPVS
jgi:hypothetical protein